MKNYVKVKSNWMDADKAWGDISRYLRLESIALATGQTLTITMMNYSSGEILSIAVSPDGAMWSSNPTSPFPKNTVFNVISADLASGGGGGF